MIPVDCSISLTLLEFPSLHLLLSSLVVSCQKTDSIVGEVLAG